MNGDNFIMVRNAIVSKEKSHKVLCCVVLCCVVLCCVVLCCVMLCCVVL